MILRLLLIATALAPAAASAQAESPRGWSVVPLLGFGVVLVGESRNSAGMEAALELEYRAAGWRWSGFSSVRGLGAGCSESCFDGGPAFALGLSRSFGQLGIGGGIGTMRNHGLWRTLPYGRLFVERSPVRVEMRIELPDGPGLGTYVPVLVGVPFPRR